MKLKTGQYISGNPKQQGQPVGIGKTVYPDKVFPTIWHYKAYWEKTIGKVSHNIHKN